MSTEKYVRVVCDDCREASEMVDPLEMTEAELRRDLVKRLGWLSYRTEVGRGHRDVCPACISTKGGK